MTNRRKCSPSSPRWGCYARERIVGLFEKSQDGVRRMGRRPLFKFTYAVTTIAAMVGWLWLLSKVVLWIV